MPEAGGRTSSVRARPHIGDEVSALQTLGSEAKGTAPASSAVPAAVTSQARAGWEAYQRGDVKAAKNALSEAARSPSAPPWVHYVLGWSHLALAEYQPASVEWEHVRKAAPEFEAVYFDLADSYLQQHEYGKAIGVLREGQKRWPRDVELFNALGVVQAARGAVDASIETFEEAVTLNPDDATACYNLAKMSEVRYVRLSRLKRNIVSSTDATSFSDRERAREYYRRTVLLGGPFVESAKEGLKRLGGPQ